MKSKLKTNYKAFEIILILEFKEKSMQTFLKKIFQIFFKKG